MDNIIEALTKNERPFGLMPEEMQAKAREIDGDKVFEVYRLDEWMECGDAPGFQGNFTYRLRDTYEEPEAGVEKCEIYPQQDLLYYKDCNCRDEARPIDFAVIRTNFIGYLYEDCIVSSLPRMYRVFGLGSRNFFASEQELKGGNAEVLIPTAVLFRKQ